MNRLFRSNSMASSSRSSFSTIPNIVNEEDYEVGQARLDWKGWNIPKVSSKEIYKTSWLLRVFDQELQVRIIEQVYPLSKSEQTCQLLTS